MSYVFVACILESIMGAFRKISNETIQSALEGVSRQYLVGDLKIPQILNHIHSDKIEVGISKYTSCDKEKAHYHTQAYEFQYVISGYTEYLDVGTNNEFQFRKGDFFIIEPNTVYTQKIKKGTEILFFKTPPGNDKVLVEQSDNVEKWLSEKIKTIRYDYYHEDNSPPSNSLKPATSAAIVNKYGQVLFLKRKDNELWTLPGGTLKNNENLVNCIKREVYEETGLKIDVKGMIGTYTDPNIKIAYSDGEVRREFTIVYYAVTNRNDVKIDDESLDFRWISAENMKDLCMAQSQYLRVIDLTEFLLDKKKSFLK